MLIRFLQGHHLPGGGDREGVPGAGLRTTHTPSLLGGGGEGGDGGGGGGTTVPTDSNTHTHTPNNTTAPGNETRVNGTVS